VSAFLHNGKYQDYVFVQHSYNHVSIHSISFYTTMGYTISYTMFQIHSPHTNTNPRRGRGAHHDPTLERARLAVALVLATAALCLNGIAAVDSGCGRQPGSREMTTTRHWSGRGWQSSRRLRRAAPVVTRGRGGGRRGWWC
jgi:hypothetical protein